MAAHAPLLRSLVGKPPNHHWPPSLDFLSAASQPPHLRSCHHQIQIGQRHHDQPPPPSPSSSPLPFLPWSLSSSSVPISIRVAECSDHSRHARSPSSPSIPNPDGHPAPPPSREQSLRPSPRACLTPSSPDRCDQSSVLDPARRLSTSASISHASNPASHCSVLLLPDRSQRHHPGRL